MSLLTTDEACELLRVTKKTLYKHVQEGKVPAFMIGTEYRFNRDEVLA
ncbi:MAG: helix-turn-helix domain-containing protein, partial [Herbaspirillum sp.]|nr:helix-turn-helix domain-containing protein [Herbaspirillum sp.]